MEATDGDDDPVRVRVREPLEPETPDPENVAFVLVGVLLAGGLIVASI